MKKLIFVFSGFYLSVSVFGAPAAKAPKETADLLAKGQKAYSETCVACHSADGDSSKSPAGKAINARNLPKDPFKNGENVENIFDTITNGLKGTAMISYAGIPEDARWGIAYMIKSWRKGAGAAAPASPVKPAAPAAKPAEVKPTTAPVKPAAPAAKPAEVKKEAPKK